ncbi:DUF2157 domain-containing protein [Sphingobacterium sp. PU5-4]|uniref:DUF2157 domain-containing protein n=1 Tax=Sphingobacterium tenebrionis TaxID=3111775 RepID=A0ABU8I3F2_9SPHI
MERKDIHIIARNSDITQESIQKALQEKVFQPKNHWDDFFRISMMVLGIGFFVIGLIFFFAYNWQDLHKFAKIGIIEGLIILLIIAYFRLRLEPLFKQIILSGSALLVGALFAVFGQVYQTGANAYDFFLAWTLFIALWTFVSKFPPLWIIFIALINISFILYVVQVANHWSWLYTYGVLTLFNGMVCMIAILLNLTGKWEKIPAYFIQLTGLASIAMATIGICLGIYKSYDPNFYILLGLTAYLYGFGIYHGVKHYNLFFLTTIPFSLIIMISASLLKASETEEMVFVIGLFIIVSVTLLVRALLSFQRKHRYAK